MTPLGHAAFATLAGVGLTKVFPATDPKLIISATATGGIILDLDLFYRFYQKGKDLFDGTIGQHRFFPSHTPLFSLLISLPLLLFYFPLGISLLIGLLLHLILDTLFFPEGINFLYPASRKMTTFLTISTHPFWAPKPISQTDGWWKNYLTSPLFWIAEALPAITAFVLLLQLL